MKGLEPGPINRLRILRNDMDPDPPHILRIQQIIRIRIRHTAGYMLFISIKQQLITLKKLKDLSGSTTNMADPEP